MAADAEECDRSGSLEGLVGQVVGGKYHVDRLIGRGGMGAVFQATNQTIGKRVALKFLGRDAARDRDAFERFQREALAASLVESAHIVHLFDSGRSDDGRPFLVMELLSGEDLRARLRREGKLPIDEAVALAKQVLRALVRAHGAGIVHRDLKPDNLYLCERDDGALYVKIVDFGISKLVADNTLDTLTRRGTVLGTAYYMSPEQAQAFADVDGRTDLFSVGAILFECLSGRPPHTGPTYEAVLIGICTKDAEDVRRFEPAVPEELSLVVQKALCRDRGQRFQSADEFLAALTTFAPSRLDVVDSSARPRTSEAVISPHELSSTSRTQQGRQRVRSWIAGGAAVLLGFALTALWVGARGERAAPASDISGERSLDRARSNGQRLLGPPPSSSEGKTSVRSSSEGETPPLVPAPSAARTLGPALVPSAVAFETATSPVVRTRVADRGARRKPAANGASSATPRSGVAPGLELSTRGP